MVKMALCCGTATPPTVTAPTTPGNRWGRVLPHSTDPAQPQTSPDNPAGAHGVAILRRHFRLSKPPVFPLQILFFSLWHPICTQGAAFVGGHETSSFRYLGANRIEYSLSYRGGKIFPFSWWLNLPVGSVPGSSTGCTEILI